MYMIHMHYVVLPDLYLCLTTTLASNLNKHFVAYATKQGAFAIKRQTSCKYVRINDLEQYEVTHFCKDDFIHHTEPPALCTFHPS